MKRKIPVLILILVLIVVAMSYYFYLRPGWENKSANGNLLKVSGNIETHESVVGFKAAAGNAVFQELQERRLG